MLSFYPGCKCDAGSALRSPKSSGAILPPGRRSPLKILATRSGYLRRLPVEGFQRGFGG